MAPGFALPLDDDFSSPVPTTATQIPPTARKALILGTPSGASDGSYQRLVDTVKSTSSESGTEVELQMIDRILEGATELRERAYDEAWLALGSGAEGAETIGRLVKVVVGVLKEEGRLEIVGALDDAAMGELRLAGFVDVERKGTATTAKKSSSASLKTTALPLRRPSTNGTPSDPVPATTTGTSALPLRRKAPSTGKATKIWSLTAPTSSTEVIDEDSLLTTEDRLPSSACAPIQPGSLPSGKRRKRACANCSCGLREIEEREAVLLDEEDDWKVKSAGGEKERLGEAVKKINANAVSSSCGSCYLGDAFRCAGCPYLGLPAFEPGEKVLLQGMGDDV